MSRFKASPRHSTPSSGAFIVWTSDNCPDRSEEKQISLWLGKGVLHRKSGTIGAAVGLCRKKTESRGVNIIRGRKGHSGRRLNTPPRPYDLPTFFPPQFPSTPVLVEPLGHLSRFLGKRSSLHSPPFLGQNLRKDFFLPEERDRRIFIDWISC